MLDSETDDEDLLLCPPAASSEEMLGECMKMTSRFVVVPAIPTVMGSMSSGTRFYCNTSSIGFNIYDNNEEKLRLTATCQAREKAEAEICMATFCA